MGIVHLLGCVPPLEPVNPTATTDKIVGIQNWNPLGVSPVMCSPTCGDRAWIVCRNLSRQSNPFGAMV